MIGKRGIVDVDWENGGERGRGRLEEDEFGAQERKEKEKLAKITSSEAWGIAERTHLACVVPNLR